MNKRGAWLAVAAALSVAHGCSEGSADIEAGTSSASSGGQGGSSTETSAGGDGGFNPTGTGGGTGGTENCLETSQEGVISPLDMIVLLDRSESMVGEKWDGTVAALDAFFQSPGGDEISVGMSYFPPPSGALECQPSSYDPPHVPIVDLLTSAATLTGDLTTQQPTGYYTPTWGGLYGTLRYANDYQDDNPTHVVAVVLASDGDPTSCNTDIGNIAELASIAHAYNGVRTFVIAINGATLGNLDQIAAAGGTGTAIDVTSDISQFTQAMQDIRREILACEFIIPDPEGEEFDPTRVNVRYTAGGSGAPEDLPQADNYGDCGDDPGWYYDNPAAPTKILLCPASCEVIQADDMADVDFIFGCPTIVN